METTTKSGLVRWAPWWAIALTLVSLVPGALLLWAGLDQLFFGMSDAYMSELAASLAPFIIAIAVILLLPGLLYLVIRQKFLFVVAMIFGGGFLIVFLATVWS